MTEKVVSLSGGLILGMICALFLGIGATQSIPASSHFEMPSFMPMTISQNTHAPSTPANDTTPSVNVATPSNPDRGRITRIATLEETTDPVFEPATTIEVANTELKYFDLVSTPKIDNSLQRTNLQRSYIASGPQDNTFIALGTVAAVRQNNYTSIAGNTAGGSPSSQNPPGISDKPQTQGSPPVAHDNPGSGEGSEDEPAFAGGAKPKPSGPDADLSNNNIRNDVKPRESNNDFPDNNGGSSENDSGNHNPGNHNPRPNIHQGPPSRN